MVQNGGQVSGDQRLVWRGKVPDWYNDLVARCGGLPEPLRAYGLQQCKDAWDTYLLSADWRIPHQLREEVESLEFALSQMQGMSSGQQQAHLAQARFYLWV